MQVNTKHPTMVTFRNKETGEVLITAEALDVTAVIQTDEVTRKRKERHRNRLLMFAKKLQENARQE